jgi:hypothetical protein
MRNMKWLRFGLGSCVIAGASVATLLACGDDDNGGTPTGTDSGVVDTGSNTGTSGGPGTDSGPGPGTDSGPVLPPARVQLVNAATDMGPSNPSGGLRVCYGLGDGTGNFTQATLPALPELQAPGTPFPGLFIGTGGSVPGAGISLAQVQIQPYLMNAQSLFARGDVKPDSGIPDAGAPSASCQDLFGTTPPIDGGALVENVDYWKLPVVPAGTLADGKSLILLLTGCAGDSTAGAKCGAGFTAGGPGPGNLTLSVIELDITTAVDPASVGAQFIHAATAGDVILGTEIQHPGFVHNGTFKTINGGGGGGGGDAGDAGDGGGGGGQGAAVPLGGHTDLHQVSGVDFTNDSFTAAPDIAALAIPLPQVLLSTYGGPAPAAGQLKNGASFTFIAVGDPSVSPDAGGGAFNPRTYHYLALPNEPQTVNYAP